MQTDEHTDRQKYRLTDIQTNVKKEGQTNSQTDLIHLQINVDLYAEIKS